MKHSTILTLFMARKWTLLLFIILSTTSQSQSQTDIPSAGLLCISDCETCPVICSPPPSPPSTPPATPKSPPPSPPPPSVHHHSPPLPYYFDAPSPSSSPPAHPSPPPPRPPPSPSYISWGGAAAVPPPPSVYVYNPGAVPPGMGQKNYSYPYYYFYTSGASSCYLPLLHQGFILLVVSIFLPSFV